ncbi:hypothetical protein RchiOBHm_Chr0c32g0501601 [Rosa chinensis]|uniref:Uncharacterized protein n=2 Tax=Rosa chinensis TaxID=74649 RepID=A0A2P6SQC4_ROSCH|nr:hypothetical protein RchiOBHm_Chr0c32g0501601 [Rosa chinensis]
MIGLVLAGPEITKLVSCMSVALTSVVTGSNMNSLVFHHWIRWLNYSGNQSKELENNGK